eukprot:TRINITY_DN27644_c0_g2_i1.p1 TRINITY_DN27644_c0_g2~~TRINITY_DN27644_c0_g2_i1.p1  ORF type:complete len:586 (+),score=69.74 TRINITY_DN27644_c0_g2_i1:163-1920(+)
MTYHGDANAQSDESPLGGWLLGEVGAAIKRATAHCGGSGFGGMIGPDGSEAAAWDGGFASRAELRAIRGPGSGVSRCSFPSEASSMLCRELSELTLEYHWDEVAAATCDFDDSLKLGSGACGTVYRATLQDGLEAAVKIIDEPVGGGFEEEVRVLSRCRHPHVVMLLGFARSDDGRCALVYELLRGGDAHSRLQKSNVIPYMWHERLRTAIDVARGLSHLHRHRPEVFHRDIKSPNILFSCDGIAKIADFGLACESQFKNEREVSVQIARGTPGYADPVYAATGLVTEGAEVYSLGMVLLELLTSRPPAIVLEDGTLVMLHQELGLHEDRAKHRILERLDARAAWPLQPAAGVATLALLCVHNDANRRPSFVEVASILQDLFTDATSTIGSVPVHVASSEAAVVGAGGSHAFSIGGAGNAHIHAHVARGWTPTPVKLVPAAAPPPGVRVVAASAAPAAAGTQPGRGYVQQPPVVVPQQLQQNWASAGAHLITAGRPSPGMSGRSRSVVTPCRHNQSAGDGGGGARSRRASEWWSQPSGDYGNFAFGADVLAPGGQQAGFRRSSNGLRRHASVDSRFHYEPTSAPN